MKGLWMMAVAGIGFSACNNTATVKINTDSVGTRLDEKAEKLWDTTKQNLKETGRSIRDKVKDGLDNVEINISRDSTNKKN